MELRIIKGRLYKYQIFDKGKVFGCGSSPEDAWKNATHKLANRMHRILTFIKAELKED